MTLLQQQEEMSEKSSLASLEKSHHSNVAGFTLVELLAVVFIMAILAVLLFSAVHSSISTSRATYCLAKMHSLGSAAHGFIGDHNMFLPYRSDDPNWMFNLGPYLGLQPTVEVGNIPMTTVFLCPDDPSTSPKQLRTYRYVSAFPSPAAQIRSSYIPSRYYELARPSTLAMLVCVANTGPRLLEIWRYDQAIWKESAETSNPPGNPGNFPRPHYNENAVNILYADGHVAKAQYPLPPETWHFDGK